MTAEEKRQLVLDIVHAHMKGSDDFHDHMRTALVEMEESEYQYVTQLVGAFPRKFKTCSELIYQLLSTVVEIKNFCSEKDNDDIDVGWAYEEKIQNLEVKEYAPWSQ